MAKRNHTQEEFARLLAGMGERSSAHPGIVCKAGAYWTEADLQDAARMVAEGQYENGACKGQGDDGRSQEERAYRYMSHMSSLLGAALRERFRPVTAPAGLAARG